MIAREWTAAETRFVERMAGLAPIGKLAADLDRDPADVADECARIGVDPRYTAPALHWCPRCSSWRPVMTAGGHCLVCERRAQLARIEGQIASLLLRLPPEDVETYAVTEAERGSRIDPRPRAPNTRNMDERAELAARIAYEAELSGWEERQLHRRVKAAQKRKERIAAKVRENGRRTEA